LSATLLQKVEGIAANLYDAYVRLHVFSSNLEEIPYTPTLMRFAIFHSILSTAILITYEQSGAVFPTEESVVQADRRLSSFITRVGVDTLYKIFFIIAGHDLMQPHVLHRDITETEFLEGNRHHPYSTYELQWFLMAGLAHGSFRMKVVGNERVIQLNRLGMERFIWSKDLLQTTGYIQKRISLSYVYQFDHLEDFDEMSRIVWPSADRFRSHYVEWVGIADHARVLEVACGTGGLTFDGGLYGAVNTAQGRLTAIDSSQNMLNQAERKSQQEDAFEHILFQQASVENLPFADSAFDIVLGSAFLHFVRPKVALAEMIRVVAKGGIVSVYQSVHFDLMKPFFQDWFEPLFRIAQRHSGTGARDYLPMGPELYGWFRDSGLRNIEVQETENSWVFDNPEVAVQHLIRGVHFFQEQLMELPWDDRKSIMLELIDRGRDVCRRYSLADRTVQIPSLMLKGRRSL